MMSITMAVILNLWKIHLYTADLSHIRLEYEYSNGELLAVKVKDKDGVTLRHCIFTFSSSHQLQQMDWDVADGNVGFYLEQTMTFQLLPGWERNGNCDSQLSCRFPGRGHIY